MVKNLLYLFSFLFLAVSCNKEKELISPEPDLIQSIENTINFEFKESDNPSELLNDVACQVGDNQIIGFIPYLVKSDSLVATFNLPAGFTVTVNNVVQISGVTKNDFNNPVVYVIKTPTGFVKQYVVKLSTYTGLPIININTEDNLSIDSKDVYINAHMKISGNSNYTKGLYNGLVQIKGRGNTTWHYMPKKPYKIKLNQKAQILDMPADKEWVLLANYADKTLLRNYVSLELSRRLGLKFTPRSRFVEVFLNNEYIGNYLLTEEIKIAKDRVNIAEMSNNDVSSSLITGGYLLEIDSRQDAEAWFVTNQNISFCIKSPQNIVAQQLDYIKNYIQQTEDALYSDSFTDPNEGYAKYINIDSFVNWYLLNEITKNTDAAFHTSVYLYKDRNGKLNIGPAWDYDLATGNVDYNDNYTTEGFFIQESLWINRLFQDPAFEKRVIDRFNQLKTKELNTLNQFIYQASTYINKSQAENFKKWDILNIYVWPNSVVLGSHEKEVAFLTDWLEKRIAWMDKEFNQYL